MAKAKTFTTFNGLLIYQVQDGDEYVVSLVGDREGELIRTPVRTAATKYFNSIKAHYEARRIAETEA